MHGPNRGVGWGGWGGGAIELHWFAINFFLIVAVELVEWALSYGGDSDFHSLRRLLNGTESTSYFEFQVKLIYQPVPGQHPKAFDQK
jgi:hypothetical protein